MTKQALMIKQMQKLSRNSFSSDLVAKLPPPSNDFGISLVRNYYQNILAPLPDKFNFSSVTEDFVLKL